jgi:hypothetical protein
MRPRFSHQDDCGTKDKPDRCYAKLFPGRISRCPLTQRESDSMVLSSKSEPILAATIRKERQRGKMSLTVQCADEHRDWDPPPKLATQDRRAGELCV